jgi:hypothetical protein
MLCCDYDSIVHYIAGEFAESMIDTSKEQIGRSLSAQSASSS